MQTYDIFIVFILLIVIEESLCFMRCKIPHSNVCTKMTISGISNDLAQKFIEIDKRTHDNMKKILDFYREERVDSTCFHGVNGYGYGDYGREKFDRIVAKIMGAEDALVRLQFFSGTHAIACALFSCLRSGDTMLAVSGQPYDTLEEVIGLRDGSQTGSKCGSLFDWGISYEQIDLKYECTENKVSSAFEFDLGTTFWIFKHLKRA